MIDGFVLAGGRSSRMGFDKARAPWGRVAMAVAAAEGLRAICDRVAIVRRGDDGLPWLRADDEPVPVVLEADDRDRHPLWGVVTALSSARTELVAVVPADVPGISAETWRALRDVAPAAAHGPHGHALCAVLSRSMAARAEELARAGAPARALLRELAPVSATGGELADHDSPSSLPPGPVSRLLATIPVDDPASRARVAAGERFRLRARGILDPR